MKYYDLGTLQPGMVKNNRFWSEYGYDIVAQAFMFISLYESESIWDKLCAKVQRPLGSWITI